ncbi:MAG TPA: methylmalonyl Co-A mutase-associated GTPase MeaB [Acidimicrobiales bacterium]|nr:methylmalonyl Co-A mutase-associated GTPase MeaB [Acidimicrobiales bacterium]
MPQQAPEQLVELAGRGDRGALARLISAVERGGPAAREVGRLVYPKGGQAYTVGITGAPGAGKSTLTDRLIGVVRKTGSEVGVLAVDPSSPFSGGAILGDRVRMQEHATDRGVFIRSMATRGHLGGLSLAAPEAIRVLDAAGLPVVLVETVGVGQVEVEIAGAADTTVVVLNPGWGDAVQANKAGLLEIADVFVVNKADRPGAQETEHDLHHMLDMNMHMGEWRPPVLQTVAVSGEGIEDVWGAVEEHRSYLERSGELARRRERRLLDELREIVVHRLEGEARARTEGPLFDGLRDDLLARRIDPYSAADRLLAAE